MPRPEPLRALIVEDDLPLQELLVQLLRSRGFVTQAVDTVAAGLEQLRMHESPHCLLLDLCLPDGAGTKLLQHLRAKEMTTKVAVVTGTEDKKLLRETMRLQPDHILKKPFGLHEIEAWLSMAVVVQKSDRIRQAIVA